MTLRLILTRHAKSAWGDPMIDDHERPLSKRGRKSAKAIGAWLGAQGCEPDEVLVSPSERTRETWMLIRKQLGGEVPKAAFKSPLYHGEPEALLNALRAATGQRVMIIAHNPGIAYFARALLKDPPIDSRFERYPTGATTLIDFEVDSWERLTWRQGAVAGFVLPRDLVEE